MRERAGEVGVGGWWDRLFAGALEQALGNERLRRRWAPRSRRRKLVMAEAAATVATLAVFGAVTPSSRPWGLLLALGVLTVLTCYLASQVNIATRLITEIGTRALDERQLAWHTRARTVSHGVTRVSLLVLWVAACAAWGGEIDVPARVLIPLIGLATFLHVGFPAAYLAWTLPDEPVDDEE
ncbi:hypothetical protein ACQEU5_09645 [Marinactinospora thermotolerans]|uniref:hypothetical protein n=1 Tax=Marinactinospora thermotolerans TaxID=531310 RepID=UPI001184DD0B|nr:hypothetical protein [Marinactinospora thermotolerans]